MSRLRGKSFIDVQFDNEDRTWLSVLGVGGILAGIFIAMAGSWDRWFPDVLNEAVPPEARMDGPSSTGSTLGDAGPFFGTWLLLGAVFAVGGLWMIVRDSRRASAARKRAGGGGGAP